MSTALSLTRLGVNVRFPSDFLIGFADAYKTPLKQENLAQNSNVYLRDLTGDQQDLEAALISAGFHDKAINAIYMKERRERSEQTGYNAVHPGGCQRKRLLVFSHV